MEQQLYFNDIPSLHAIFPHVPDVFGNLDLNIGIQAGAPIDLEHRRNAKSVTAAVKVAHKTGYNKVFTPEVVEAAELRELAVDSAQAMAMYTPGNLVQVLGQINNQLGQINGQMGQLNNQMGQLDNRMGQLNDLVALNSANCENLRIIARNRQNAIPANFQPLLKTRPGHGLARAILIFQGVNAAQQFLVPPEQEPQVGTVPADFHTNLHGYTMANIIRLIIFYNDSFGIVHENNIETCVDKIQAFLTAY